MCAPAREPTPVCQRASRVTVTDHNLGRDLAAFLDDHRDCVTLDTGFTGEPERVWLSCSGGRGSRGRRSAGRPSRRPADDTSASALLRYAIPIRLFGAGLSQIRLTQLPQRLPVELLPCTRASRSRT